jgi:ribosome-binding protein aMBF1 (putative translation factor)
MQIIETLKGLFRSAQSVSSSIDEMTERTAKNAVSPLVQSLLSDVCIAIMNNQQASSSPLSKEELEQMLTQVALVISTSCQQHAAKDEAQTQKEETPLKITKSEKSQESSSLKSKTMMERLMTFLRTRYHIQYNVLTRETEMLDLTAPTTQYVVVTKREENTLVLEAQAEGIDCWNADVNRIIHCSKVDEYHPFIQYFENLPKWDGQDRVKGLAERISDNKVWTDFGCHRWLLSAVAQWMHHTSTNDRANCVAPLLISEKQGQGKSTVCRMLLPTQLQRYYTENFDLSNISGCEHRLVHRHQQPP